MNRETRDRTSNMTAEKKAGKPDNTGRNPLFLLRLAESLQVGINPIDAYWKGFIDGLVYSSGSSGPELPFMHNKRRRRRFVNNDS